jgi:hypothetical protein
MAYDEPYDEPFQINLTMKELTVLKAIVAAGANSAAVCEAFDTVSSVIEKVNNPLDLNA